VTAAVAIVPPAAAAAAVIGRSNVGPVDLGRALRSHILRQLASVRGSLVHLVVVRWVSGREIDGARSFRRSYGGGSRGHRFEPNGARGGVAGL